MIYFIEALAVLFSISSVLLAIKKSIQTWTIGILGIIGYMIIFWNEKLYADFFLQFIFIAQSIWGYYLWKKNDHTTFKIIEPSKLIAIVLTIFVTLSYVSKTYTDNSLPVLDALSTTLSILAIYLMSIHVRFSWIIWMIANLVYVLIFIKKDLILSASLYFAFFFLAWNGYLNWKNEKI